MFANRSEICVLKVSPPWLGFSGARAARGIAAAAHSSSLKPLEYKRNDIGQTIKEKSFLLN